MIVVEELSKSYGGPVFAVRDLSFRVEKGEVVGFLGPNGAGKSTTLRVVAGFLGASSGRVLLGGVDLSENGRRARSLVGYMPESVPLYPEMRAIEYLSYRCELKGVARRKRAAAVARAMEQANTREIAHVVIGHLSKGYRQRVGLADALLGDPPILILDEPTAGLDPNQIREVRDLIRSLGRERAVLLSTHILSEVEATCDRALVIAKGQLVAQGSLAELRKLRQSHRVGVVLGAAPPEEIVALVEAVGGVAAVEQHGARLVIRMRETEPDPGRVTERVARALVQAGCGLRVISPMVPSLEELFAQLTLDGPAAATAPPQAHPGPDASAVGKSDRDAGPARVPIAQAVGSSRARLDSWLPDESDVPNVPNAPNAPNAPNVVAGEPTAGGEQVEEARGERRGPNGSPPTKSPPTKRTREREGKR